MQMLDKTYRGLPMYCPRPRGHGWPCQTSSEGESQTEKLAPCSAMAGSRAKRSLPKLASTVLKRIAASQHPTCEKHGEARQHESGCGSC